LYDVIILSTAVSRHRGGLATGPADSTGDDGRRPRTRVLGVYTTQAARLVLALGWWLLAGGLVATVAEAFARVNLLSQLVTWNVDWGQWPVAWTVSWPVALIGLGLITFARIMRISAGMRADLEGTV
jgi:hypothetical protein